MTTTTDQSLDFIKRELSLPSGIRLADTMGDDPWLEEHVFRPILATNADGLPEHSLVYIELARGHAKTSSVAGIAIEEALREPGTDVFCTACDQDQARLVWESVQGQCRRNPAIARRLVQRQNRFEARNGSTIRILSADAASNLGLGVNSRRLRIVCDELSMWPRPDLWFAMVSTLPKIADSQIIVISNAGVSPGNSWVWDVRESARQHGYLFSASGVIASWIKPEQLALIEASVPPAVYQRFYENKWVEETGSFVSAEEWTACEDLEIPPLDKRTPVVVGVDAGVTGDYFAAVVVSRDPKRPVDSILVRDVAIWMPPPGGAIDYDEPRAWLTAYAKSHTVIQVTFDPYQLHFFMKLLMTDEGIWTEAFDQGPARAKADSDLYQAIRSQRIHHDGNPQLREHIANCAFKVSAGEDSRARLVKGGKGKIDGAVALSMASSECLRLNLDTSSVQLLGATV